MQTECSKPLPMPTGCRYQQYRVCSWLCVSVLSPLAPPPSSSGHSQSWSQTRHSQASAELQGRAAHTGSIVQTRKPGDGDGCWRAEVGRAAFLALGSSGKGTRVPSQASLRLVGLAGLGFALGLLSPSGGLWRSSAFKPGENRIHLAFLFSYIISICLPFLISAENCFPSPGEGWGHDLCVKQQEEVVHRVPGTPGESSARPAPPGLGSVISRWFRSLYCRHCS